MDQFDADFRTEATQPPVKNVRSPFVGLSTHKTAAILSRGLRQVPKGVIDADLFAILDEESLSSESGLIVQVKDGFVDSVRVHFDTINAELIRTSIITFNIEETKRLVGHDGVYRTMPSSESQKGKSAPPKKLGQLASHS